MACEEDGEEPTIDFGPGFKTRTTGALIDSEKEIAAMAAMAGFKGFLAKASSEARRNKRDKAHAVRTRKFLAKAEERTNAPLLHLSTRFPVRGSLRCSACTWEMDMCGSAVRACEAELRLEPVLSYDIALFASFAVQFQEVTDL